jgi:hypothetical protein
VQLDGINVGVLNVSCSFHNKNISETVTPKSVLKKSGFE